MDQAKELLAWIGYSSLAKVFLLGFIAVPLLLFWVSRRARRDKGAEE
jgi:hypothetical protein